MTVHATEAISISGQSSQGLRSALSTLVQKGSGDGGELFVSTPELLVTDGGSIAAATLDDGNSGDIRLEVGRLTLDEGLISAYTLGDGNAGDIEVRVGTLTLSNGGAIGTAAAEGNLGRGGTLTIFATDSISLSGRSSRTGVPSILVANARKGSGDGGQIFISAPILELHDGAGISFRNLGCKYGQCRRHKPEVGKLTMTGDAFISSGTQGLGQGGDIQVQARQIELNNSRAAITASGSGPGNAGNIEIHADDTFRSRNSVVSTASTLSGGGKINLSAGQIVELVDSQVTTAVQGGAGDAGNITIGPRYVILNDSQVIARAVEGNGGNIHYRGRCVSSPLPTSVVDASSPDRDRWHD